MSEDDLDAAGYQAWLERMKRADAITIATVERMGGHPSFRELEVGRAVAEQFQAKEIDTDDEC